MAGNDENAQPEALGILIAEQLAEERARKSSIEARGILVVTTSATLVTALLAIAGLVGRRDDFVLSNQAAALATTATGLLLLAAVAAVITNVPRGYEEVGDDALRAWVTEEAWHSARDAERVAAEHRVDVLAHAREINGRKARALLAAMCFQVMAILTLGVAVAIVLLD